MPSFTYIAGAQSAGTATSSFWTQPAIIAAIIAGAVAGLGVVLNFYFGRALQRQRQAFEESIAERRLEGELALARERTKLDRDAEVWRRKAAFAEETLENFYEVRSLFKLFRSGTSFRNEAEQRQGRDQEPEELRDLRDQYYYVLKRMDEHLEPFNRLHARRFRAMLLFGPGAEAPFMAIRLLHARIQTAGQALMRAVTHQEVGNMPAFKEKMENLVWEGAIDPDPVTAEIDAAVAQAEEVFGPTLRTGD